MFKIPDDITLDFIIGTAVELICFHKSGISIYFGSSNYIAIEGRFMVTEDGNEKLYNVYPVTDDSMLVRIYNPVLNISGFSIRG